MPRAGKRARSAVYDELTPQEVRDALARREEQKVEYGTWVASMDITVPFQSQLAYTAGSPVPVSNVERWDYDTPDNYMGAVCVVRQDSEEGKALLNPGSTTARVAAVAEGLGMSGMVSPGVLGNVDTSTEQEALQAPAAETTAAAKPARAGKEN